MERTRTCRHCGEEFSYPIARGMDRVYCSDQCSRKSFQVRALAAKAPCANPSCEKIVTSGKYCIACTARLRRRGTLELVKPKEFVKHTSGYILIHAPDHPLTLRHSGSKEYQHRVVFYDANGDGPFNCHWCGCDATWDEMHVDHVNAVKDDNRIENLVASCATCNIERGRDNCRKSIREKRAHLIEFGGKKQTPQEWADEIGITRQSLIFRLKSGWSVERALTTPRGVTGPQRQQTA